MSVVKLLSKMNEAERGNSREFRFEEVELLKRGLRLSLGTMRIYQIGDFQLRELEVNENNCKLGFSQDGEEVGCIFEYGKSYHLIGTELFLFCRGRSNEASNYSRVGITIDAPRSIPIFLVRLEAPV